MAPAFGQAWYPGTNRGLADGVRIRVWRGQGSPTVGGEPGALVWAPGCPHMPTVAAELAQEARPDI
jgi:hypothetical protein